MFYDVHKSKFKAGFTSPIYSNSGYLDFHDCFPNSRCCDFHWGSSDSKSIDIPMLSSQFLLSFNYDIILADFDSTIVFFIFDKILGDCSKFSTNDRHNCHLAAPQLFSVL